MNIQQYISEVRYECMYDTIMVSNLNISDIDAQIRHNRYIINLMALYSTEDFIKYGLFRIDELNCGYISPSEIFVCSLMKYGKHKLIKHIANIPITDFLFDKAIYYRSEQYMRICARNKYMRLYPYFSNYNHIMDKLLSELKYSDICTVSWLDKYIRKNPPYPVILVNICPSLSVSLIHMNLYNPDQYACIAVQLLNKLSSSRIKYLRTLIFLMNAYTFNNTISRIVPILVSNIRNNIYSRSCKKLLRLIATKRRSLELNTPVSQIRERCPINIDNYSEHMIGTYIINNRLMKCMCKNNYDKICELVNNYTEPLYKIMDIVDNEFFKTKWSEITNKDRIISTWIHTNSTIPNVSLNYNIDLLRDAINHRYVYYIKKYMCDIRKFHRDIKCILFELIERRIYESITWLNQLYDITPYIENISIINYCPSLIANYVKYDYYLPALIGFIKETTTDRKLLVYTLLSKSDGIYYNILEILPYIKNVFDDAHFHNIASIMYRKCSRLYQLQILEDDIYDVVTAIYNISNGNIFTYNPRILKYIPINTHTISRLKQFMTIDEMRNSLYVYEFAEAGVKLGKKCDICFLYVGKELLVTKQPTGCKCNISYCLRCFHKLDRRCCVCKKLIVIGQ